MKSSSSPPAYEAENNLLDQMHSHAFLNGMNEEIIEIRKYLHSHPELSGRELHTAEFILSKLKDLSPDEIISQVGGNGIIAVFDGYKQGKTLVFRCELDALPIQETTDLQYISTNEGISHACGHDGHMAIMLALGHWIKNNRQNLRGRICLLFQPSEETGLGAKRVIEDRRFTDLNPDYIFALHNLPGFKLRNLILKKRTFAAASMGMKFWFTGKTSHAGHPENGISPLAAMHTFISELQKIPMMGTNPDDAGQITIIHINLGEEAFGTAPGNGVIMATLRANSDETLGKMASLAQKRAEDLAKIHKLTFRCEKVEIFAATQNDDDAFQILIKAAKLCNLNTVIQNKPFPWSEDFSYFAQKYKTTIFGVGSGTSHPQLHNSNYDFPDELIETGKQIFTEIIKQILFEPNK